MNNSTYSFVILSDFAQETVALLQQLNLEIVESEIDLGFFTVQGNSENIENLKSFLQGDYTVV